jgi:hypothetical protein
VLPYTKRATRLQPRRPTPTAKKDFAPMSKYDIVSPDMLRQLLDYDPDTGLFVWRSRAGQKSWNTRYAGTRAFANRDKHGYQTGTLLGLRFFAHRIAWAHVYRAWPSDEIDHVNHDRSDNRIANLRPVDRTENRRNISRNQNNKSGVCGVHWASHVQKWIAQISVGGAKMYLGCYADLQDAARARKDAETGYAFHPNHGKRRKQ